MGITMPESADLSPTSLLDSTKIKTYQTCPRKFFYEHVLGWTPDVKAHALWFGIAVHDGLELYYHEWRRQGRPPGLDFVNQMYEKFLETYRKKFGSETDETYYPKSPENVLLLFTQYLTKFEPIDGRHEVIHTEISGLAPIDEDRSLYFRLDTVLRDQRGQVYILEHKTSSWGKELWSSGLGITIQAGTGNHILRCLYGDQSNGVKFNGLFFRRQPRLKKDGEPYANAGPGNEFLRVPVRLSVEQQQEWLLRVNRYFDEIEHEMQILLDVDTSGRLPMQSFPKSESGCHAFNRTCPFMDFCSVWSNPLEKAETVPVGFKQEHWDPRSLDREWTEKVEV